MNNSFKILLLLTSLAFVSNTAVAQSNKLRPDDEIESLKVSEKDLENGVSQKKLLKTEVLVSQSEVRALEQIKTLIANLLIKLKMKKG